MSREWSRRSVLRSLVPLGAAPAAACSPTRLLDVFVPESGYRLAGDQPYGRGPRQRLDAYLPTASTPAPATVVFIYGGNWRSGDKGIYRFVGQALASMGYAVVIPDYRVFPEVRFPDFLADNAAAVAWTRAQGPAAGLGAGPLFLMGHSAGAYNAAMLTLDERWLAAVGLRPSRDVRGFVGLAGPYDFYPFDDVKTAEIFAAAPDPRLTQPVAFVDGSEPPMLLATGLDDDTVRPRNTMRLAALVRERGGAAEVRTYPDVGHIRLVAAIAEPLRKPGLPVLDDVVAFLRAHS